MKGYVVSTGYMGCVEDTPKRIKYKLFPTEEEYREYMEEQEGGEDDE